MLVRAVDFQYGPISCNDQKGFVSNYTGNQNSPFRDGTDFSKNLIGPILIRICPLFDEIKPIL